MGFRSEELFGEGYRNPVEVMAHETFSLQNDDILETLSTTILKGTEIAKEMQKIIDVRSGKISNSSVSEFIDSAHYNPYIGQAFMKIVVDEIEKATGQKLDNVLWLCEKPQDIIHEYCYHSFSEITDFDEYKDGFVILSDLGSEGKLYGYTGEPEYIKTVSRIMISR